MFAMWTPFSIEHYKPCFVGQQGIEIMLVYIKQQSVVKENVGLLGQIRVIVDLFAAQFLVILLIILLPLLMDALLDGQEEEQEKQYLHLFI